MSFSVVIVLHDSEPELELLLRSIATHLPERPQLIVVDTGSRDGGVALATVHGAEVITLPDNPASAPPATPASSSRGRKSPCC